MFFIYVRVWIYYWIYLWLFFVGFLSGIENIFVVNMLRRVNKEVCRYFFVMLLRWRSYVFWMEEFIG